MQLVLAWSHAERFLRCISHSQQQVAAPMRTGTGMRLEPVGAFSQAEWHIHGERLAGHLPTMQQACTCLLITHQSFNSSL